jgi:hypothetical protein
VQKVRPTPLAHLDFARRARGDDPPAARLTHYGDAQLREQHALFRRRDSGRRARAEPCGPKLRRPDAEGRAQVLAGVLGVNAHRGGGRAALHREADGALEIRQRGEAVAARLVRDSDLFEPADEIAQSLLLALVGRLVGHLQTVVVGEARGGH